jgi:hypothetical protein
MQMDQHTPDVIHDRHKEFVRQKAKPTHHMQLETNNIGSVNHGEIEGSQGTNQHPRKPTDGMIGIDIVVCHHWLFPVMVPQWDFLLSYGLTSHGGGRGTLALCTSRTLTTRHIGVADDVRGLDRFISHGGVEGGAIQQAVNGKQKVLRQD